MRASIEAVGVAGAGTIGASWAAFFLSHGLKVTVFDPNPDMLARLPSIIAQTGPDLIALGRDDPAQRLENLVATSHWDALGHVDFVQENGPENLDAKREILQQIEDVVATDVVIASSTSGLMPSDLQAGARHPERILVGHPFNPPHLLPLVEIVPGRQTAPEAADAAKLFYESLGKTAIVLRREVPGHVATRLVAALWREVVYLVEQDVCDLEDIDRAIVAGPGPRWAVLGQGLSYHLGGGAGGLRHFLAVFDAPVRSWWDALGVPVMELSTKEKLIASAEKMTAAAGGHRALVDKRNEALVSLLNIPGPLSPTPTRDT